MRLSTLVLAMSMALAGQVQSAEIAVKGQLNKPQLEDEANRVGQNPFFSSSKLPFQAPPFNLIKESDYAPAIEFGIAERLAEVNAIANNPTLPTFKNTFIALEKSGGTLTRVMNGFGAMTSANSSDVLQKIDEETSPKLAAMEDAIKLNSTLFNRIKTIYDQRDKLGLDDESRRLVEVTYTNFILAGANLSDADKTKLKALNQEAAGLSTQFTNKLLAATKNGAVAVKDKSVLAGLSEGELAAAAQAAGDRQLDKQWLLVLQNTTQQPVLKNLSDRDTRKSLFDASWNRAEQGDANDTRQIVSRLAKIRAEQAQLLGFPNYAAWKLQNQMAKTPDTALTFMRDIVPAATARAEREAKDIQAVIDRQNGGFKLGPEDWKFYAEQVRKEKYDLDESQINPYFELDNVLNNGVFYAANQLFGISFKERTDLPVYHPDVRVYDVIDKDGQPLALFYTDYFKRDNKGGGAWMSNFVDQSKLLGTKPVIYNVANFTKPAPGQPALLSYDDVITLFHEFGHALHGIFADQQYPSLSGTATARDFVEFPSQLNEHWASDPKVFANYAKHYKTGEPMPQELVDKIQKAKKFNKGYSMTELLSAALLDMNWHMLNASQLEQDVDKFEKKSLQRDKIDLSYVPPRYRSSYFQHIWGNGYAAGYYAYLWTEMLADDAFVGLLESGGLTPENGQRLRDKILSRGNSQDLEKLYIDWRGQAPSIEPMLINRGLKEPAK
ncbi:dipeptidyl carboxypeptidase II [Yersinia entomophaga]|uniref:Dipeptidyl carboxypeptidase II n=1 Tax=Yersinia entomophaga TaxID=935293 RepID=A0ABM6BHR1_YERET|nr:peptidyl-dipeptidase Dcp [Yersinia entomophaga]ANI28977.1 dipeptidyl carboxypeptidase II [Yersinia entomophaga]OWF88797.1 dipeptidyl carboxypeptidase II [Yersinia entomophaga]